MYELSSRHLDVSIQTALLLFTSFSSPLSHSYEKYYNILSNFSAYVLE
jgi:hypothetical protein